MRSILWLVALVLCAAPLRAQEGEFPAGWLEESVCGYFGVERSVFASWRDVAQQGGRGKERAGFVYDRIEVLASDRRRLSGLRIRAAGDGTADRALLVLLGNAMLADQLKGPLTQFAERGYHVFVFDYRGYGHSEGNPYLKPIVADQKLLVAWVKAQGFGKLFVYGMSFGGVLAAGLTAPDAGPDAVVIDSGRAVLPWFGFCPDEYDPVNNVPARASHVMVLSGGEDTVVPADEVRPLGERVAQRGGVYRHIPDFAHPMMESDADTRRRFAMVVEFLTGF